MPVYGKVTAVVEAPTGTTLAAFAGEGDTVLQLDDVSQLSWPAGTLALEDEVHGYTVDTLPDQNTDSPEDLEVTTDIVAGTVTLDSGIENPDGYPTDTVVAQYPDTIERQATVILPAQQEEMTLRVPQHLTDRLATGIRDDPEQIDAGANSETIELEQRDDDWLIVDMVDQRGPGFSRAQASLDSPLTVTAVAPAYQHVCLVQIEIPTAAHRIIVSWSAHLGSPGGTSDCWLGFNDSTVDFATPLQLAQFDHNTAAVNPQLAAPMLPQIFEPNLDLHDVAVVVPPDGVPDATASMWPQLSGFTGWMPYTTTPPTVGLHTYRLVAWTGPGGTAEVADASLWVAVI